MDVENQENSQETPVKSVTNSKSRREDRGGRTCCVPLCGNKTGQSKTSFHAVPVKESERTLWLDLCKVDEKKRAGKYIAVCGEHFSPGDFSPAVGRPRLKKGVLPNRNLPSQSITVKHNCVTCGVYCSSRRAPVKTLTGMSYKHAQLVMDDVSIDDSDVVHRPQCEECCLRVDDASSLEHEQTEHDSLEETGVEDEPLCEGNDLQSVEAGVQTQVDLTSTSCQTDADVTSTASQTDVTSDSYPSQAGSSDDARSASVSTFASQEIAVQATVLQRSIATQSVTKGLLHNVRTDKEMKAFTGVTFQILSALEGACETVIKLNPDVDGLMLGGVCPLRERIGLTLCKIKTNLSFVMLGAMCGVSDRTAYSYFTSTLSILACGLGVAVYWPEKEEVLANIPDCFLPYKQTRVVLDCTEIPVEKPQCLKCRTHLYSNYKTCETVKVCIGVTPCGIICFVSEAFGGRASDKAIVKASGILDKLLPKADAVMVDKGFLIDTECAERHIQLIRPPFASSDRQMSQADAAQTRKIARARVHVERAIQRMKNFQIMRGKLEWSLVPFVDQIITVVAGIVNLSPPILSDTRFVGESPL